MVDLKTVIYIIVGLVTIGGAIVSFFTMQTRQNMKIEHLEMELEKLKDRQSLSTGHQIETEKTLCIIGEKLDRIIKDIDEIKERRAEARPRNNISQGG